VYQHVLHDWPDEDCVRILERCKEAIESTKDGGKVIVVDMILDEEIGDEKATETNLMFNLHMMSVGAKERTKKEWHDAILSAGYSSYKMYPARMSLYSIIELYP
jgi:trans-resveratrol di-O-methyltransferase